MKLCAVEGCGRKSYCRGWCTMHYSRWLAHGDPLFVIRQVKKPCSVEGCDRLAHAHGFCIKHLARWEKHGDPLYVAPILGRPLKGEVLSIAGMHKRLSRVLGPASERVCVDCGGQAQEWSYDGADPDELHGVMGGYRMPYSLDMAHYQPRCVRCHRIFDGISDRPHKADGTFARRRR